MSTTIFPQSGDTAGELAFQHYVRLCGHDHVRSVGEMEVTHDTGLDVIVSAGHAILNGVHVHVDTDTTITVNDDATNYVYLKLTRDASDLVQDPSSDSDNFVVTTSTETGPDYLPLAIVRASGGSVESGGIDQLTWVGAGPSMSVRKTTTEQRTNTTDGTDGDLQMPLPAGYIYRVEASIAFDDNFQMELETNATPDAAHLHYFSIDDAGVDKISKRVGVNDMIVFSAETDGIAKWEGFIDMRNANHGELDVDWGVHSGDSAYLIKGSVLSLHRINDNLA